MPALDPLSHIPGVMPGQTGSQILPFAQNDSGGQNDEGRQNDSGHAMNVYGSTPGFPLPDNKCRGQASREGQEGGGKDREGRRAAEGGMAKEGRMTADTP